MKTDNETLKRLLYLLNEKNSYDFDLSYLVGVPEDKKNGLPEEEPLEIKTIYISMDEETSLIIKNDKRRHEDFAEFEGLVLNAPELISNIKDLVVEYLQQKRKEVIEKLKSF